MLLLFDVSASMTVFGLEDDSFVDMEKILISGNHHMQVFLQCFFSLPESYCIWQINNKLYPCSMCC